MLEYYSICIFLFPFFDDIYGKSFQVDDFLGHFGLSVSQHEDSGPQILQIDRLILILEHLLRLPLDPGLCAYELGVAVLGLPDVGVEAGHVHVEQTRVLQDQAVEVLFGEHVGLLVQVVGGEQEVGVLTGQTCDVRLHLQIGPVLAHSTQHVA